MNHWSYLYGICIEKKYRFKMSLTNISSFADAFNFFFLFIYFWFNRHNFMHFLGSKSCGSYIVCVTELMYTL